MAYFFLFFWQVYEREQEKLHSTERAKPLSEENKGEKDAKIYTSPQTKTQAGRETSGNILNLSKVPRVNFDPKGA